MEAIFTRDEMPQIEDFDDLIEALKKFNISTEYQEIPVTTLKPTQNEYDIDSIKDMASSMSEKDIEKKPIVVSRDGFVIDGHHRWLALLNQNETASIRSLVIDMDSPGLITLIKSFSSALMSDDEEYAHLSDEELDKLIAQYESDLGNGE